MSTTKQPVCLKGSYDAQGIIHVDPNGSEEITVEYSRVQHHNQASVYVNHINQGFVTFGLNGERAVNTFVQGFGDSSSIEQGISNIMAAVH